MRVTETHLRSDEVCRVTRCHEEAIVRPQLLRKAEVADVQALRRSIRIGVQQVGRLQVSVDHL